MKYIRKIQAEFVTTGLAFLILSLLLLTRPVTGVADNGDFARIMNSAGLQYLSESPSDRYFGFVNRLYGTGIIRLFGGGYFSTEIPLVLLAAFVSKIVHGSAVLDIRFLSSIYILLLATSVFLITRSCRMHFGRLVGLTAGLIVLFIFCDIGYSSYFNSLYGEPVTEVFLLMTTASAFQLALGKRPSIGILILFGASMLFFTGAKLQNSPSGLLAAIFFIRLVAYGRSSVGAEGSCAGMEAGYGCNGYTTITGRHIVPVPGSAKVIRLWTAAGADGVKNRSKAWKTVSLAFAVIAVLMFLACLNVSKDIRVCNKYQTVFYGILRGSPDPAGDLAELGMDPSLSILADTNYFMEKYPIDIRTDAFREMTYEKISYVRIMRFYLHHPLRFLKKLQTAAENGFRLKQGFGNYEKYEGIHYKQTSNTFGLWSDFKLKVLPHSLLFVFLFYLTVATVLVYRYMRAEKPGVRLLIEFLGFIALTGIMQFILPLLGDGEADLSKHLFLFNACFDLLFAAGLTYLVKQAAELVSRIRSRLRTAGIQTE